MTELARKIEGVLFLAGEGLSGAYLAEKLGVKDADVKAAVSELEKKYDKTSGVHIVKYRGNYQFSTNPEIADAVATVLNPVREKNLTRAAMETMAIVAYKQPVTKLEIDEIRGVASDYAVHVLIENNLIRVTGRKEALGKPLLYGTTDEFLKRFELDNIDKLPSYDDLMDKLNTAAGSFDLYGKA